MSIMPIATFNPSVDPQGNFPNSVTGNCVVLHLLNESLESFWLTDGSGTYYGLVPALWSAVIAVKTPPSMFAYAVFATQNAEDTTLQQVQGAIYSSDEDTSKLYSGPLPRIANVGNPGSVSSTVSGGTLVNTGNAANTQVVQIASTGATGNTYTLTNDGLMQLAVTIAGALISVLQTLEPGSTGNDILKLGALNYITHVLGDLNIDGVLRPNTIASATVTGNETVAGTLGVTGASTLGAVSTTGVTNSGNETIAGTLGVTGASTLTGQVQIGVKKLQTTSANNLVDWTGTGVQLNGNPATHGRPNFSQDGTNIDWYTTAISTTGVTVSASGTVNHNVKVAGAASTPNNAFIDPYNGTPPGSQTMGIGSFTTTTAYVTCGASLQALIHFWQH